MKSLSVTSLLIASLLLKVLLSYFIPVFGDETYYYIWSLHPQLSYFDHPPMVSWFIYLGHLILPAGNPISLRISFILAGVGIALIWVAILRMKHYSERQIFLWLVLFFLNPLLGIGSLLATPDTPLVLFWSLSFLGFLKILNSNSLKWYALTGVFLGLGFCSKYHIVLFVVSGLIYLLISKKWKTLRPAGIFMTVFFGAIFSGPVIVWNAQNNWSSFLFQINHGFGEDSFEWAWPAGYLVAQILIISPVIVFSFFQRSIASIDKTFSISQIGFFFLSSFKSVVEGNWPLTSHLHSISYFSESAQSKFFKYSVFYWLIFYGLVVGFLCSPFSEPVKKNLVNSSQLVEVVPLLGEYSPLFGASYQVASLLSWQTQKNIPKLSGLSRLDFYDSLPDSEPTTASFYVLKYDISDWPANYQLYKKIKIRSFDNISLGLYQFIYE